MARCAVSAALEEIAAELDFIDAGADAEAAHGTADELLCRALRELGDTCVVDAYKRLIERSPFWATA